MKSTARRQREAKKRQAQFQEVTWDELERTSLLASVSDLLNIAAHDAATRQRAAEQANQERRERIVQRQRDQERREALRVESLANAAARKEFALRLEHETLVAREQADGLARQLQRKEEERLERLAGLQRVAELREAQRNRRKTTALWRALGGLAIAAAVTMAWTGGSHSWLERTHESELASLRIEASNAEEEARAEVQRLERALAETEELSAAESSRLEQAIARAEMEATEAEARLLEYDRRKTAPRKVASATPTWSAQVDSAKPAPKATTTHEPTPPIAVNDFGMSASECDSYDPLCGNL